MLAAWNRPSTGDRHDRLLEVLPEKLPAGGRDVAAVDEGQPAEVDAEEEDEDDAGEESRQREADEGDGAGDAVEPRVGLHRGQDAHRQRDQDRQHLRQADHDDGGGQPLPDELVDVDAALKAEAPVALEHAGQPQQVALPHRIVQAELLAQHHAHFGGHVRVGGQFLERVARRQRQHGEQHDADAQQAGHRDQQAAKDVVEQAFGLVVVQALSRLPPRRGLREALVAPLESESLRGCRGRRRWRCDVVKRPGTKCS